MRDEPQPVQDACRLAAALGRDEPCAETRCAFWEPFGAHATTSGCGLRPIAPYLRMQPELARQLLELRARLDAVRAP
jgi:hypothetical protein